MSNKMIFGNVSVFLSYRILYSCDKRLSRDFEDIEVLNVPAIHYIRRWKALGSCCAINLSLLLSTTPNQNKWGIFALAIL